APVLEHASMSRRNDRAHFGLHFGRLETARSVPPVYAVVPGVTRLGAREARPDLHVVGPLLLRVGTAAVVLHEEDAIDRIVVNPDVRAELVGDLLAVDRHPHPSVAAGASVPEHLELEPLSDRHGDRCDVYTPELLLRKIAVGDVVCPHA